MSNAVYYLIQNKLISGHFLIANLKANAFKLIELDVYAKKASSSAESKVFERLARGLLAFGIISKQSFQRFFIIDNLLDLCIYSDMKKTALVFYLMILIVAVREPAVAIEKPVPGIKDFIVTIGSTFARSICSDSLIANDQSKDILSGAIMIAQHFHPSNPQVTLYHLFLAAMTEVYFDGVPMTYTDINLLTFLRGENLIEDFQDFLLDNLGLRDDQPGSLFEKKSDGALILNLDTNMQLDHNGISDFNNYTAGAKRLLRVAGISIGGKTKDSDFFPHVLLFDNPIRRFFFDRLTEPPTLLERTLGRLSKRWSHNSMRIERITSMYSKAPPLSSSSIAHIAQREEEGPSQLETSGDSARGREDIEVAVDEDYQFLSHAIPTVTSRSNSTNMTVDLTDPSLKKWMGIATNIIKEKTGITPGPQNLVTAQRVQIYRIFHDDIVPLIGSSEHSDNKYLYRQNLMSYDIKKPNHSRSIFRALGYVLDRKSASSIELSVFGAILFSEYGLHTRYMTIDTRLISDFERKKVYEYAWIGVGLEDGSLEFIDTNGRFFWSPTLRLLRERYPRLSSFSDEDLLSLFSKEYILVTPPSPE